MLDHAQVLRLTQVVLQALATDFPNHVQHLFLSDEKVSPQDLHPAFYASYDWHSCVHMHWSLLRLINQFAPYAEADSSLYAQMLARLDHSLQPNKIAAELAYFQHPARRSFSRPYGWAWALKLDTELRLCALPQAAVWREAFAPLATHLASAFEHYLSKLTYAVRHGVHSNTAFACVLALQWARLTQHDALANRIINCAQNWFGDVVAHGVFAEPSGSDFLSPTLTEALLMQQVLPVEEFQRWFVKFFPFSFAQTPLAQRLSISDRSDPQIVHLEGLNLSRAWCARGIAAGLPFGSPMSEALNSLARNSLEDSAPQVLQGGDFVASHWLASFLLLAHTEYCE